MEFYRFVPMLVFVALFTGMAILAEWISDRPRRHRPRRSH